MAALPGRPRLGMLAGAGRRAGNRRRNRTEPGSLSRWRTGHRRRAQSEDARARAPPPPRSGRRPAGRAPPGARLPRRQLRTGYLHAVVVPDPGRSQGHGRGEARAAAGRVVRAPRARPQPDRVGPPVAACPRAVVSAWRGHAAPRAARPSPRRRGRRGAAGALEVGRRRARRRPQARGVNLSTRWADARSPTSGQQGRDRRLLPGLQAPTSTLLFGRFFIRGSCSPMSPARSQLVQYALRLEVFTIGWNVVEGIVAVLAATVAGSVALLGFGIDSFVESASGAVPDLALPAEKAGSLPGKHQALD